MYDVAAINAFVRAPSCHVANQIMGNILKKLGACSATLAEKSEQLSEKLSKYKEFNLFMCATILFASTYITAVSVFRRPLIDPLYHENGTMGYVHTTESVDYGFSVMSMFVLWMSALIAGRLISFLHLPDLLGVLLCGIAFKNIPFLSKRLFVDQGLNNFLRKTAFTIILIRGGIGLEASALKRAKGVISRLGVLSPIIEAASVAIASYFLFGMGYKAAIVFGMVLAATSPAVTIPTMLRLSKKGYGTHGGVPTVVLAAAAIDNMVCITLFNVFLRLITSKSSIIAEIGIIIAQIFIGFKIGFSYGVTLRYFPSTDQPHFHFTRGAMLFALSMAFIFGGQAAGWDSAGVIGTILVTITASLKWKTDNPDKAQKEADTFKLMWNLGGMQVLFVLIGYEFDFQALDYGLVLRGLIIITIGVLVRIVAVYILSFGGGFKQLEQIFVSLAFLPKATVQAALVPQLVEAATGNGRFASQANIILTTCVFAILITAPVGQFILQILGPLTLKPKKRGNQVRGINDIDQARDFDKQARASEIVVESINV